MNRGVLTDEDALYFTAVPGRGARTQVERLFPLEPDRVTMVRARDAQRHDRRRSTALIICAQGGRAPEPGRADSTTRG